MSDSKRLVRQSPFSGKGIRERVLRRLGAGDLYDSIASLSGAVKSRDEALAQSRAIADELRVSGTSEQDKDSSRIGRLEHFESLANSGRLIELEYAIHPKMRHGGLLPEEPRMARLLSTGDMRYAEQLTSFLPVIEKAISIPSRANSPTEPHWQNDWLPAFDAISIYAQLALKNPKLYLEIGSGTSTKFARRAIQDFGLQTRIVSIDPYPRSEIDSICDEVIRLPLEDAPLSVFDQLQPGDMLFFDGSHRSFQNSDVTVFFTEILPSLKNGVLTGVHDILLPTDYPTDWLDRHYNEQYLLACWLLAGDRLRVELPLFYLSCRPNLSGILDPLWKAPNLIGAHTHGCAFWFTPTGLES
jgi:Predicted O-methyltransferase